MHSYCLRNDRAAASPYGPRAGKYGQDTGFRHVYRFQADIVYRRSYAQSGQETEGGDGADGDNGGNLCCPGQAHSGGMRNEGAAGSSGLHNEGAASSSGLHNEGAAGSSGLRNEGAVCSSGT